MRGSSFNLMTVFVESTGCIPRKRELLGYLVELSMGLTRIREIGKGIMSGKIIPVFRKHLFARQERGPICLVRSGTFSEVGTRDEGREHSIMFPFRHIAGRMIIEGFIEPKFVGRGFVMISLLKSIFGRMSRRALGLGVGFVARCNCGNTTRYEQDFSAKWVGRGE